MKHEMTHLLRRLTLTIAILSLWCSAASAQLLQATRSHYSTDDGLCSNAISKIKQDDYGYIWIATWNGLSRFDGYNFYNYKTGAGSHIPNLHNRLTDFVIDNQQNIWMRMYDGRVFVLKRSIDRIINPFESISGNDEFRTSIPIFVSSTGDVMVSIDGVGIYRFRPDRDTFSTQLFTTSGYTITTMAEGYQGDIWVGTEQGVHRVDMGNMTIERNAKLPKESITCLYLYRGYNIYAGTQTGTIYKCVPNRNDTLQASVVRTGNEPITSLYVDEHENVWFSDNRQGASCVNHVTGQEKLYTQQVLAPEYDSFGADFHESKAEIGDSTETLLWIRMNHGGYGYYNPKTDIVEYFHNDPSNPWNLLNSVNAMCELDEGVVFESTGRRGLEKLEILKNTIKRKLIVADAQSNLGNEIRALLYDEERHQLLIGNKANTLFFYDDNFNLLNTITHDSNGNQLGRVYGLMKDSKGNYWMASKDYGLYKISPKPGGGYDVANMRHDDNDPSSISSNQAYSTVEDRQGNIWVATYSGGINVYTKGKTGKLEFLNIKNGMPSYPYRSYLKSRTVTLDRDGNVWAGTTDGIIIMSCKNSVVDIKRLEQSEIYPDSILLSSDIVCMALDKKGVMWVGTNGGGLSRTTGKDKDGRWLFRTYGAQDGLPSEEIRSITFDQKGNVWFATDNDICSFDTEKEIFTTFSNLDGVDDTGCSEGAAITMGDNLILIGTVNGYYVVDRRKLSTNNASALKLRITDFWMNDEMQSPRLNNYFSYYVPDSREITLKEHNTKLAFRFASLNYQLQHRVHYQYMLEGYDKTWQNADRSRIATYPGLPTGTYRFKVKAFLLESPEWADVKEIAIIVPPPFLLSSQAIWLYMVIAAVLGINIMLYRQRKIRLAYAPSSDDDKDAHKGFFAWLFRRKKQKDKEYTPKNGDTDYYEMMD
jgi:ligand-binding sensor domain-containing protein